MIQKGTKSQLFVVETQRRGFIFVGVGLSGIYTCNYERNAVSAPSANDKRSKKTRGEDGEVTVVTHTHGEKYK